MSDQIGSLYVNMALESGNFVSGLRRASQETDKAKTSINNAMGHIKTAVAGLATVIGVDAFIGATQRAFDYADSIVDIGDKTGASTRFVQEFGYAAQMSGSSVESANGGLEKFAKLIGDAKNGSASAQAKLKEAGVSSYDLDTAVRQAADGIAALDDRQAQSARTMELMGKKAGDLTMLMSGGSQAVDELANRAATLGIVLEDSVLRNAGQVNDQLDTMKMIVNAQMANMIIQNADALATLANGFIQAAGAAARFNEEMNVKRLMSTQQNNPFKMDIPRVVVGRLQGKSIGDMAQEDRAALKRTSAGRTALYKSLAGQYNDGLRRGDKGKPYMLATRGEMDDLAKAEVASRRAGRAPAPTARVLPTSAIKAATAPKAHTAPTVHLKSDAELASNWKRAVEQAHNEEMQARQALITDATQRAELERQILENEKEQRLREIAADAGTDQAVREGKARYTRAQADVLRGIEEQIYGNQVALSVLREQEQLNRDKLSVTQSGLQNDIELLNGQEGLARSARERREIALRLVDLQYQQERLALDAIVASKTATDAEKQIAEARLRVLGQLRGQAAAKAREGTRGPLDDYLNKIPKTGDEIDEAMQGVAVEGLDSLKSGLLDCIKGTGDLGDAFSNMADRVIDGLLEIALQQAILKPLGEFLFGGGAAGGGGGGGILGGLIKGVLGGIHGGVKGGKANGGLGNRGSWLVGEHGPEVVEMGGPFNVVPNHKLEGVAGGGGGINVTFGAITSNDPEAVKAMAYQAITEAAPMLMKQSSDYTIGKLRRPGL